MYLEVLESTGTYVEKSIKSFVAPEEAARNLINRLHYGEGTRLEKGLLKDFDHLIFFNRPL